MIPLPSQETAQIGGFGGEGKGKAQEWASLRLDAAFFEGKIAGNLGGAQGLYQRVA